MKLFRVLFCFLMVSPLWAGETYTKISASGSNLSDAATDWACVRHNVTGQVWEVKTLLNQLSRYRYLELQPFVNEINQSALCGYSDWRLPSIKELNSLLDESKFFAWFNRHGHLTIDLSYFPNTQNIYWSATTASSSLAWSVSFLWGGNQISEQSDNHQVRLVRGDSPFDGFNYSKLDGSGNVLSVNATQWSCVLDNRNGLVWEVKNSANQSQRLNYSDAESYANGFNSGGVCGRNGWRIPELEELESIVDYSRSEPAIDTQSFPNTGSYTETLFSSSRIQSEYWAKGNSAVSDSMSRCVNFRYGESCARANNDELLIRLVTKNSDVSKDAPSDAAKEIVQKAYLAYYGRPGDPDGIDYWANRLDGAGGGWTDEIINAFGNSNEFSTRFGELSDTQLITNIYQQLFNRDPEAAGLAYFLDQLQTGQASLAQIAVVILNGAQGDDSTVLANKLTACDYFTRQVRSGLFAYNSIDTARSIIAGVALSTTSLNSAYSSIDQL